MVFVCLFVFYVPSTARSLRDGTPIYCPLRRTCSSVNTPFPPGIKPQVVFNCSIQHHILLYHTWHYPFSFHCYLDIPLIHKYDYDIQEVDAQLSNDTHDEGFLALKGFYHRRIYIEIVLKKKFAIKFYETT